MLVRRILEAKGSFVATIPPTSTLADAARTLVAHGIGALVVSVDGQSLDGIFSERDLARALGSTGADALEEPVSSVMSHEVRTCGLDDTIDVLMAQMTEGRFRHLPVIDEGDLVGIISIGDVVKRRVQELQTESKVLHDYLYSGR